MMMINSQKYLSHLYLQFDIWLHLSSLETHWPSSQVNWPESQADTFMSTILELSADVQGSSFTLLKSNLFTPSNIEFSKELLKHFGSKVRSKSSPFTL